MRKILMSCFILVFTQIGFGADHKVNVRVDPIGLLFGSANIGADFAVSDEWALGAALSYSSFSSGDTKVSSIGVEARAQYFFDGVFSNSWYVGPYASYSQGDGESPGIVDSSVSITSLGAILGYMWMWENFNIQLGGGVRHLSVDAENNSSRFDTISGIIPALEFSFGYAF